MMTQHNFPPAPAAADADSVQSSIIDYTESRNGSDIEDNLNDEQRELLNELPLFLREVTVKQLHLCLSKGITAERLSRTYILQKDYLSSVWPRSERPKGYEHLKNLKTKSPAEVEVAFDAEYTKPACPTAQGHQNSLSKRARDSLLTTLPLDLAKLSIKQLHECLYNGISLVTLAAIYGKSEGYFSQVWQRLKSKDNKNYPNLSELALKKPEEVETIFGEDFDKTFSSLKVRSTPLSLNNKNSLLSELPEQLSQLTLRLLHECLYNGITATELSGVYGKAYSYLNRQWSTREDTEFGKGYPTIEELAHKTPAEVRATFKEKYDQPIFPRSVAKRCSGQKPSKEQLLASLPEYLKDLSVKQLHECLINDVSAVEIAAIYGKSKTFITGISWRSRNVVLKPFTSLTPFRSKTAEQLQNELKDGYLASAFPKATAKRQNNNDVATQKRTKKQLLKALPKCISQLTIKELHQCLNNGITAVELGGVYGKSHCYISGYVWPQRSESLAPYETPTAFVKTTSKELEDFLGNRYLLPAFPNTTASRVSEVESSDEDDDTQMQSELEKRVPASADERNKLLSELPVQLSQLTLQQFHLCLYKGITAKELSIIYGCKDNYLNIQWNNREDKMDVEGYQTIDDLADKTPEEVKTVFKGKYEQPLFPHSKARHSLGQKLPKEQLLAGLPEHLNELSIKQLHECLNNDVGHVEIAEVYGRGREFIRRLSWRNRNKVLTPYTSIMDFRAKTTAQLQNELKEGYVASAFPNATARRSLANCDTVTETKKQLLATLPKNLSQLTIKELHQYLNDGVTAVEIASVYGKNRTYMSNFLWRLHRNEELEPYTSFKGFIKKSSKELEEKLGAAFILPAFPKITLQRVSEVEFPDVAQDDEASSSEESSVSSEESVSDLPSDRQSVIVRLKRQPPPAAATPRKSKRPISSAAGIMLTLSAASGASVRSSQSGNVSLEKSSVPMDLGAPPSSISGPGFFSSGQNRVPESQARTERTPTTVQAPTEDQADNRPAM